MYIGLMTWGSIALQVANKGMPLEVVFTMEVFTANGLKKIVWTIEVLPWIMGWSGFIKLNDYYHRSHSTLAVMKLLRY